MRRAVGIKNPRFGARVFVAPSAIIVGDVELVDDTSVWNGVIVRGDIESVRLGARSNLQDAVVVHVENATAATLIGEDSSVGHGAILHGCRIGDSCLIGMGASILNHAVIGDESIVAAGAVVREGFEAPPRSLIVGVPAIVKRELTSEEVRRARTTALNYLEYKSRALSDPGWKLDTGSAYWRNQ